MTVWLKSILKIPSAPSKAQSSTIIVQGIPIIVTRKQVRGLRLSVRAPEGQVRLSAPWFVPQAAIVNFAHQHLDWIRAQQAKLISAGPRLPPPDKARDMRLRQELRIAVAELMDIWEPIIGVKAAGFGIKRMKTRWGSCNTVAKRIWINLELATKPRRCLEYVLVHELVHLLEPSHNARFKAFMTQFLPDWKSIKQELNIRGAPLSPESSNNHQD